MEQYKNNAVSTLVGNINNSVTTITVTDGSEFPADGNFRILIDSEIMICSSRATNVLTVSRGEEGSVAASHTTGSDVRSPLTTASLLNLVSDAIQVGATRPTLPRAGNLFAHEDGGHIQQYDGTDWHAFGPVSKMTPVDSTGFTWVNQGSATVVQVGTGASLRIPPASSNNLRVLVKSLPVSKKVTMCFNYICDTANFFNCGIILRESSSGKLVSQNLTHTKATEYIKWNSVTSFNAAYSGANYVLSGPTWVQYEDTGGNRIFRWSIDGVNFLLGLSVSNTDFCTPDQVGFYANYANPAANDALINVLSWKEG